MKRRCFLPDVRMRALAPAALAAAIALSACGGDPAAKDTARLGEKELSTDEQMVAEALIVGFRQETGVSTLRDAEIDRAACYAKNIDMPDAFADVHKLYLADYASIDADFYPWFADEGVSMEDAWDIAARVKNAFDACATG